MRLKYQLFLALLLASALLILLMYAISSWSFSRGLLGYANQATSQRAAESVGELESLYRERQSWNWINRHSPEWRSLFSGQQRPGNRDRPPGKDFPGFVLADARKQIIIGPRRVDPSTQWLEINNDGSVVGHLGFRRLNRLDSQLDRAFEEQQKRSFAFAAIGMVLLCALLAVPMASLLIKPLLRMGKVVEFIRLGDFEKRLPEQRKDELGELARNINQLAMTLEQNRESRQRWIAEIAHELRTPMAVLRAEIEAMQDGIRPMDLTAVSSLHSEVMRLNRLVDDLHTLSLSDVGALDCQTEPVLLEPLLKQYLQSKAACLAEASLTLTGELAEPDCLIEGDPQRLQQLFSNLFQNSIRYTDAGGSLVIKTLRLERNQVQILWCDSAPGVPADALPKLFDPLYRVEQSRNRASGGSGLGLSIASRIVKAHGGSIDASPALQGGLQIDIRLPLQPHGQVA